MKAVLRYPEPLLELERKPFIDQDLGVTLARTMEE